MSLEERGAYNDLIDIYISRDGDLSDDDKLRASDLACDVRVWRRIKKQLIHYGKLEITNGHLTPTGAEISLTSVLLRSEVARKSAIARWSQRGIQPSKVLKDNKTGDANAMQTHKKRNANLNLSSKEKSLKEIEEGFQAWYEKYPRHVSKPHALKAFKAALKKTDVATLVVAAEKYAESVRAKDQEFIAHPATWLNGERWLDEPARKREPWRDV